jgi:predicted NACHT family NTPase
MLNELDTQKITTSIVTDLAKDTAKMVFGKVKSYYTDIKKKEEIDFGYAFENYLNYSREVNCKIKTLLYRHMPKEIYSFYECIGLRSGKDIIDTCDLNNILKFGHKIVITGTGGIGKSVMMKHFFLNCISSNKLVPILIELRGLNEIEEKNIDLVDYLYQVMNIYKFELDKKYFQYSLETGCYLILLDGFDEVKNSLSNKVTKCILDICEKYPNNYYITTSRPLEGFIGWRDFTELQSMTLTKKQALSLIKKLEYDAAIKDKFYNELNENLYEKYETFASNPLLLTIMLLTFENRVSIPDKLNDFYEQAFTTLFHTHDATKGAYKRDILSGLGYEDFKSVFSYFCFKSFFNSKYKFSENEVISYLAMAKDRKIINTEFNSLNYLNDLTNSVCMLIHEGLDYRFSHRSFQEYFAALYTVQLDDEQQKKFLSAWLKEPSFRMTTNYLNMLYELQPSRYIKNVLYPGLQELNNFYKQNGQSKEKLVTLLYSEVTIDDTSEGTPTCGLIINNSYYHEIITSTCDIGGYKNVKSKNELKEAIKKNERMIKLLQKKYPQMTGNYVSIEELIEDGYFEIFVENLNWILERFYFAMDFLEKYYHSSIGRKKKLSSMLDEL